MIVTINGILKFKQPDYIIVNINGLGYECYISNNTYVSLPDINREVDLLIYHHISENNQQLFAFSDKVERDLFKLLISVSGIGPKTAITLLSAVSPDEFKRRLIASEVEMLTSLPGIGPKTARRIIVELKDKFVTISKSDLPKEESTIEPEISDACDALIALGFQMQDIKNVITDIKKKDGIMKTEEIVKKALVKLR